MTAITGVTWSLYPVGVLLPDGTTHGRVKAYATPEGLALYYRVPAGGTDEPDWFSPIDYANTGKPLATYAMRNGWDVITEKGQVTITAEGGCGCGWALKRWAPQFARKRLRWPGSA